MKVKSLFENTLAFLERISGHPGVGGMQISDSALLFVLLREEAKVVSLRLPPGVVRGGRIIDEPQFAKLLKEFHSLIEKRARKTVPAIVSLPSDLVYTQSFNVPNVGRERLRETARLNMQMISPIAHESAYMSWQVIAETPDRYELLGAFAERKVIDQFERMLEEAHFSVLAFEFPSLSLSHLLKSVGISDEGRSVLVVQVSSDGLTLFIFRNQSFYFNYFRSWRSIQGESKEISRTLFEETVAQEVQRVIHFTLSRFKETPRVAELIAPGFEQDMKQFLESRFGFFVNPLVVARWQLAPQWYTALGAALRGAMERSDDVFISLTRVSSQDIYFRERLLHFLQLWRAALGGILALYAVFFGAAAYFLVNQSKSIEKDLNRFMASPPSELLTLREEAREFNELVRAVSTAKETSYPWGELFARLEQLSVEHRVMLNRFEIPQVNAPALIGGRAADANSIIRFKDALIAEPNLSNVDIMVPQTTQLEDGSFNFAIRFSVKG